MKNLQFNSYQCRAEQVGSKETKLIPAPPHGAKLKSHPISAQPLLWGGKNPCEVKQGRAG